MRPKDHPINPENGIIFLSKLVLIKAELLKTPHPKPIILFLGIFFN